MEISDRMSAFGYDLIRRATRRSYWGASYALPRSSPSHFSFPSVTLDQAFSRKAAALVVDGPASTPRAARRSSTSAMASFAWDRQKCAWNCSSTVMPMSAAIPR